MASIGKLIQAVALVEGLDESSVKLIARYAREGGYISQASSGSGAARMTPTDAANLLIAVNATSLAKDAVTAIETYRRLIWRSDEKLQGRDWEADREDPFKAVFRVGVSLGEVLEKLILMAVPVFKPTSELEEALNREGLEISLEFVRPVPSVDLSIFNYEPPAREEDSPSGFVVERGNLHQINSVIFTRP